MKLFLQRLRVLALMVIVSGVAESFSAEPSEDLLPAASSGVERGRPARATASERVAEGHFVRVARLRTQYLQALLRLQDRMAEAGAVDEAVLVREESERFRGQNVSPDPEAMRLSRLAELARIYTTELSQIRIRFRREFSATLASERDAPVIQAALGLRD